MQCQFFKRLLNLPQCTPGYAICVELDKKPLAVTIFKITLNWISKILTMNKDRLPKICLLKLKEASNCTNQTKYNWFSMVGKIFFEPIGEMGRLHNNLGSFSTPRSDYTLVTNLLKI